MNADDTVNTVSSSTIYGALDPVDGYVYRVKVLEKVKPADVDCYTHYRVFKVDVGSQHTIETARLFYLSKEYGLYSHDIILRLIKNQEISLKTEF